MLQREHGCVAQKAPVERRLRECTAFLAPDAGPMLLDAPYPYPEADDVLLRRQVGNEEFVYGLEQWVHSDLERLDYLAEPYRDQARELVRLWLYGARNPEVFAHVIAYLYRHAIELRIKHMMTRLRDFRAADDNGKAGMMLGHALVPLWQRVRDEYKESIDSPGEDVIVRLLGEVDALDENSTAFRYPFRFVKDKRTKSVQRVGTMGPLTHQSFDNFVWVLEALYNWLSGVEHDFVRGEEHAQEMAALYRD